jgi:methionyl-tRNA formyltransferase
MRLVFMGTPKFAVPVLEAILKNGHQVIGVVTRPDKPKGRGRMVQSSPVKETAIKNNLVVREPVRLSEADFLTWLEDAQPDVIVVAAFGQILPPVVLKMPKYGCINVHASLLPRYRGAAPIHRAILNGEKETGITIMFMDEGLDTGDILLQEKIAITDMDTAGTLHDRLAGLGAEMLVKTLDLLKKGALGRTPQDHARASYAPVLTRQDELIQWTTGAKNIFNQVRGLSPWPGASTIWNGKLLKIWRVEVSYSESFPAAGFVPGQVKAANAIDGLLVQANPGLVLIRELQLQGGKRMRSEDFLRGHTIEVGTVFGAT